MYRYVSTSTLHNNNIMQYSFQRAEKLCCVVILFFNFYYLKKERWLVSGII